jgi:hypothetical protein
MPFCVKELLVTKGLGFNTYGRDIPYLPYNKDFGTVCLWLMEHILVVEFMLPSVDI